jgi:hypothetical protein
VSNRILSAAGSIPPEGIDFGVAAALAPLEHAAVTAIEQAMPSARTRMT